MKKVCEMKISVCWTALGVGLLLGCKAEPAPEDQGSENPVIENILARKSVREYTSRPIEQEKIDLLLRSGMAAPSGSDKRPWAFVVLQDRARLDTLAAELPYAKMLTQAQAAIVVCGDTLASKLWREDCCAATENILLAAESMGLGAVWTAAYPYPERVEAVRRQTGLPAHIVPLCVIPMGYPRGVQTPKDKYDVSKIHYGQW